MNKIPRGTKNVTKLRTKRCEVLFLSIALSIFWFVDDLFIVRKVTVSVMSLFWIVSHLILNVFFVLLQKIILSLKKDEFFLAKIYVCIRWWSLSYKSLKYKKGLPFIEFLSKIIYRFKETNQQLNSNGSWHHERKE